MGCFAALIEQELQRARTRSLYDIGCKFCVELFSGVIFVLFQNAGAFQALEDKAGAVEAGRIITSPDVGGAEIGESGGEGVVAGEGGAVEGHGLFRREVY